MRLINGMTPWDYMRRDEHKVKSVDFEPSTKPWNIPIGEANKTSHPVIVDAGLRVNRVGDLFNAWHSPNVVTERVPIGSFVEFGIDQDYVWRKVKTVKAAGVAVERKAASTKTSKVGEWDDTDAEASPDADLSGVAPVNRRTAHEVYEQDKEQREGRLDTEYANYVLGGNSSPLFTEVWRHIEVKGQRGVKLANIRNEPVKDMDDHVQELFTEVWPKIEAKTINGPLSHWLNRAFKLHFIDAQKALTREWDWRRLLAEIRARGPQDAEWTEKLQDAPPESLTGDDSPQPKPSEFYATEGTADVSASVPAKTRQVSLWAQERAVTQFLRLHPSDIERSVYTLILEGMKGKHIAHELRITESKVSRLKTKIEKEIFELGLALAATKTAAS